MATWIGSKVFVAVITKIDGRLAAQRCRYQGKALQNDALLRIVALRNGEWAFVGRFLVMRAGNEKKTANDFCNVNSRNLQTILTAKVVAG